MNLLLRWVVTSVALFAAAWIVPGIRVEGSAWAVFAGVAIILGLVNAVVRPLLKLLTCPLIILTLGLFVLLINGLTLALSAWIANQLSIGFYVDGFWSAFLGALIVSIVTVTLSVFVRERDE